MWETTESMFLLINKYWKVWKVGKCASWFSRYLIKQEASTKKEDAQHAFNFAPNAEDNKAHTLFSCDRSSISRVACHFLPPFCYVCTQRDL